MTPFDALALLAMLLAFYPHASGASLLRARSERPEYFSGGTIIGSSHTHLQLPDGRIFDLVFDEGSSRARWQVLYVDPTAAGGGDADPFPLEAGPLDPLDAEMPIFPATTDTFAALVAGELEALSGADAQLHQAAQATMDADVAGGLERSFSRTIEPAIDHHAGFVAALPADDPIDVLVAAEGHGGIIDAASGTYDEPAPADLPEPDPGSPPEDRGGKPGEPPAEE